MCSPSSSYVVPLFWSIQSGGSTAAPSSGSLTDGWRNTTVSAATAQANVTIARLTPRTRSAGTATTIPATRATSGAGEDRPRERPAALDRQRRHGERGEAGERHLRQRDLTDEAREDDDRQADDDPDQRVGEGAAEGRGEPEHPGDGGEHGERRPAVAQRPRRRCRCEYGRRPRRTAPRSGSGLPRRNSTATMTTRGISRLTPGNGWEAAWGNHDRVAPR